ncbi:RcnB family protein [Acinetobacter sp.]|uniref:RcnB family protein n=1 Tax=Acinetobacter sp. TaxID=472 RepID=UPI0031CF7D77
MRKSKWMAVVLALSTSLASGLTLADPWEHGDRPSEYYGYHHDHHWDEPPHDWRDHPPHDWRYYPPHDYWRDRDHPVRYWHEGEYIPRGYMDERYYVDWHEQRLPPPPYGHRWMRINGDYVLVAAASSLITAILLGSH